VSASGREPTLTDLLALFTDQLGVEVSESDVDTDLDALPRWDSVHLLRLVMLVEAGTGRRLPLPAVIEARTLRRLHAVITAGPAATAPGGGR
jgi:acyl carrier protein